MSMNKILQEKLDYWANIMFSLSEKVSTGKETLKAIADDMHEWHKILGTLEDLIEASEEGDEIIIYKHEPEDTNIH